MKKLSLSITLLLVATLSSGAQVATVRSTDSIIMSYLNLQGATAATAKQSYQGVTQGQVAAIIAGVTQYVQNSLNALAWPVVVVPPSTTKYTLSKPLTYSNKSNFTISYDSIPNVGGQPALILNSCNNVRITHIKAYNGTSDGFQFNNCSQIEVDSCFIYKVRRGINAVKSTGVVITNNQMLDILGPVSVNGSGQFCQFNNVYGSGNAITNNLLENDPGQGAPEDALNCWQSNGVSGSPITISGNKILGGGPSKTGGGILLNDGGGSWQVASNNILVNPGQYGVQIAGGSNGKLLNNVVYAASQPWTNVGLSIANYYTTVSTCGSITASGNRIYFVKSNGQLNPNWNQGLCGTIAGWNTNVWNDKTVTAAILPNPLVILH